MCVPGMFEYPAGITDKPRVVVESGVVSQPCSTVLDFGFDLSADQVNSIAHSS